MLRDPEHIKPPDVVHSDMRGAGKRLRRLRGDFRRVSARWEHRAFRRRISARLKLLALGGLAGFAFVMLLHLSPWGIILTLRHVAAFPNCAAAEAVGLAPSRIGEPGYWPRHDADHDGIACEAAAWHQSYRYTPEPGRGWVSPPDNPSDAPTGPGWVTPPRR
jgi:hypothetical protein